MVMADKKQRYDRQIRIWGEHGQAALEKANVCLLNCGPTGTEALKNLVLGGIGAFTVVDGGKVEAADFGNNYLVDFESLGQSKAKCVSALLQELNESVAAKFVEEVPKTLIETNADFFSEFSLVIATQVPEALLVKLDAICRRSGIKLLVARSYGLIGLIRISAPEHLVVESKPDTSVDDLRMHKPWAELRKYVEGFDLEVEDPVIHKHIPFGVILIKIAMQWMGEHDGKPPSNSKEKSEFKEAITKHRRSDDQDNYSEALKSAWKVWSPPAISSELQSVLSDKAAEVTSTSHPFWIMVAALKEFIEHEGGGDLPLDGSIPDMHSLTEYYVGLQKVYQQKAEADLSAVAGKVAAILKKFGREPNSISRSTIKTFCKNARFLRVVRFTTLEEEFGAAGSKSAEALLRYLLTDEEANNAALYWLLRAADHFSAAYNRYPAAFVGDAEEDGVRLKALATGLLTEGGAGGSCPAAVPEDLIVEVCRFGAGELQCIASIIGGMAAQEAIKLITRQFTPLSGTLIFNGMAGTSSVLDF
eukprot:TRINITY_DN19540_c0_g1_i1.p1 TRINITY_DN19540_c0_g1~~TRINITY_DN19540_c0_g1_i1.p1  ORF type:complete len:532 (+),score=94.51 TRINITY_DN19540_c0_g1_i1:244-1839(+)